ncbi:AraC family transcriptional regulator [Actinomadura sp. DC4]|uniref:helix-turn-helix domain-containing protein n=1 Tax=Actinomadura sp. DC4 TaxID=3055069 RepID=UPI0025B0B693|nr:AraC family transcriptional regulator [Actinomadura sp. DC4]MDN3351820.1 AraC family transcriptional regulator [Actinomadura sp. DC4]
MGPYDQQTEQNIQRVIDSIYENISERITIDDMARTAMFSKFHFTRLFQRMTGVSPGRFLSAVRLQEAKKLLLSTGLSVTEISHRVGYSSVGTFSSRFKSSVGLAPTAYRELHGYAPYISDDRRFRLHTAVVQGEICAPPEPLEDGDEPGPVFLGLFPDTIPQGHPASCAVLRRPGRFRLDRAPEGTWYLLAQSVRPGEEDVLSPRPPLVAVHGPVSVRPGRVIAPLNLQLRPMRVLDPPILLALLDARRVALGAVAS